MWGDLPTRYQKDVQPTDIAIRDIVRNTRINAATGQSLNPESPLSGERHVGYFRDNLGPGTHDFKVGHRSCRGRGWRYDRIRNGDHYLELERRCRDAARRSANTPVNSDHRLETWGVFLPGPLDRSAARRSTTASASTASSAYLPAQSSPAGTFVGERSLPANATCSTSLQRRAAPRRHLRPARQRPHRAQGLLRPLLQPVRIRAGRVAQPQRAAERSRDLGRSATTTCVSILVSSSSPNFTVRIVPRIDDERRAGRTATRSTSVSTISWCRTSPFGVSYHRRQHRDGLGIVDRARPSDATRRSQRTYTDPGTGRRRSRSTASTPRSSRSRSRHHQRRRAARATTTACSSRSTSACRTAGSCWAADPPVAPGLLAQRDLHEPGQHHRLQQPELPAEPGRLGGVHRDARGRSACRAATCCRTRFRSRASTPRAPAIRLTRTLQVSGLAAGHGDRLGAAARR